MILVKGLEEENRITCPVCFGQYVSFSEAKYIDGYDNGEAWEGRGNAIKIPCICENGHTFRLIIGFHKGESYITYAN